ncbi:MAG: nucleotidyltransferase domain-containing protein [Planctomycetes bacterium]|nr:nucleotidyltransferase domain-containing protein [Planctomycetota bacterium]
MNNQLSLKPYDKAALQHFIRIIQSNYEDQVQLVALFGSKARGDDTSESDIDVLVVLRNNDWQLRDAMRTLGARISLEHDVLLSIRAVSPDKWSELTRYQFPIYRAVQNEGVVLFPTPFVPLATGLDQPL